MIFRRLLLLQNVLVSPMTMYLNKYEYELIYLLLIYLTEILYHFNRELFHKLPYFIYVENKKYKYHSS